MWRLLPTARSAADRTKCGLICLRCEAPPSSVQLLLDLCAGTDTLGRTLGSRRTGTQLLLIALVGIAHGLTVAAQPANRVEARLQADLAVVQEFRPAYPFWQHIFTISDGRIAFGSAQDGRLVVTFPAKGGDWLKDGLWVDPAMSATLGGRPFPLRLDDRRDEVVRRLEPTIGPLLQQPDARVVPAAERAPATGRSWASGA